MIYEADVLPGLEPFAHDELTAQGVTITDSGRGWLVGTADKRPDLSALHTVLRLYRVESFPVPRPKALISNNHLPTLISALKNVVARHPAGSFRTLRLVGAGRETEVMQRLQSELAAALSLSIDDNGDDLQDLLVRIRPNAMRTGWEAVISLTPRPLSARDWRVVNYIGAMNATVAAAMVQMALIHPKERIFNPCCGSGTLLAEAICLGFGQNPMSGCDNEEDAIEAAQQNLATLPSKKRDLTFLADATATALPDHCVNVFLADLPFGQRISNHKDNTEFYPALLTELTRLAAPHARAVFLTHEIKLLEATLKDHPQWKIQEQFRVSVGGMHPRIFALKNIEREMTPSL